MGALHDITPPEAEIAPRYAAFISYAHADERRAAKLHRMLEQYRPPNEYKASRDLLRPVFRDKAELTASHSLSDDIRAAVEGSRKLIVLCSPAAKTSHWVNEEIRLFRELHGEDAILCAIVEGTPETAFPPALIEGGREPLGADLSGGPESFRYGVLQLAASLLGVGLDALVRRDAKRRRRIGTVVTLGALAFSGVMGASTYSAMKARGAAVKAQQTAEANRAEAEGLVEYMITDLKFKLDGVGRLDILDGVGDKVLEYYEGQNIADMPDEGIARQARAQHLLGEVALDAGDYEKAQSFLDTAYALTREILTRNPDDTGAIFAHAQSAFWVGNVFEKQDQIKKTEPYWQEYHDLAYRLYNSDKSNFDWVMEAAWGENNLGMVARNQLAYNEASTRYNRAIGLFDQALKITPNNSLALQERANTIIGAEQIALNLGNYLEAFSYAKTSLGISKENFANDSVNVSLRSHIATAESNLLWQYSLLMNVNDRQSLRLRPLNELRALIQYDPENLEWSKDYFWHLYILSELSVSEFDKEAIIQMAVSSERLSKEAVKVKIPFYVTAMKAEHAAIRSNKSLVLSILSSLESEFFSDNEKHPFKSLVLAKSYFEIGEMQQAVKFANLFLELKKIDGFERSLDAILQKAQAEYILGSCEQVEITLVPILKVAVSDHPILNELKNCQ